MTLWQPDLYADPEPHWHPATAPDLMAVVTMLDQQYGISAVTHVEAAGGQNVNSMNWRVSPMGVVVKRITHPARYAEGLVVAQAASTKRLPMPSHIPNRAGAWMTEHEGVWTVTEYVAGQFFRGTRIESFRVVETIDSLDLAIALLTCPLAERLLITEEELERCALLPIPSCRPHIEEVRASLPDLRAMGMAVAHVDLHPHNFLCDSTGSVVAILDVESFRWASRPSCLAFAGFKLGRQAAAQRYGEPAIARKLFHALLLYTGIPDTLACVAAKAELLKRLAMIAHGMQDHNFDWTSNLVMHVAGLEELEVIRRL